MVNVPRNVWVPFILEMEDGRFNGIVPTKKDWEEVVGRCKDDGGVELLKRARSFSAHLVSERRTTPRFGFTSEYKGKSTLGEWAQIQKIEL